MIGDTEPERVAKARILFERDGRQWALLSRKNAPGKSSHGQLEMLGGHIESGEDPLTGLNRELAEEERTGGLAQLAADRPPSATMRIVDDAEHYLFEFRISPEDAAALRHDPEESLGFEFVEAARLRARERWDHLTWRTQRIFETFGYVD